MVEVEKKTKSYYALTIAASELFHKHGFRRVTVEELCDKAGISKMTFYRFFKNKEALVKHILYEDFNAAFEQQSKLLSSDLSFQEKITASLALKKESSSTYSKDFIQDLLNAKDPEILELIQESKTRGRAFFKDFLLKSQREGHIRSTINIDFLMHYISAIQDRVIDEALLAFFDTTDEMSSAITELIFFGFLTDRIND